MQRVPLNELIEGAVLPQDLYSPYGIKVVQRGTRVSGRLLRHLEAIGRVFFLAESAAAMASVARPIDARLGARATDASDLSEDDLQSLIAVPELRSESRQVAASARAQADAIAADAQRRWADARPEPMGQGPALDFDRSTGRWPHADALLDWRDEQVESLRDLQARLLAGVPLRAQDFGEVVDCLFGLLTLDHARFPQIALLCARADDFLPDHSLSTAVLAMAAAARLGWAEPAVRTAGLAAMVQDLGMLLIPQRIRAHVGSLSDADRQKVEKHPAYTLALLDRVDEVPDAVACAAYRHHEREDGTGYPHGLRGSAIGDLGRLLAVADVAAALSAPRPFRAAPLPHETVQTIIQYRTDGLLHGPAVRALIESIGLYPIGSFVQLSDRRLAQVIGLKPPEADRPIVRCCDEDGLPTGEVMDLTRIEPWELSVLDGVAPPDRYGEAGWRAA